jgi:uridine kinase
MIDKKEQEQKTYFFDKAKINKSLEVLVKLLQEKESASKVNIVVFDGRSGAGKTTIATFLANILKTKVIHMDDFFLPPAIRTKERLNETGGNIHYERFLKDILPKIRKKEAFSYLKYDCLTKSFTVKREIPSSKWRIVEGAYSTHPLFEKYYDLKVFCDISPKEQIRRIILRNGQEKAKEFAEKWIPMEEKYIKEFKIREDVDLIFTSLKEKVK